MVLCSREGTPCSVCGSQLRTRGIGSLLPVSVGSGGGTQVARVVWQLLILFKIKSVSKPFAKSNELLCAHHLEDCS